MIIVRVELWSVITHQKTELARMQIDNIGGTRTLGDYHVATMRGRSEEALHKAMLSGNYTHEGQVLKHPRLAKHVWVLVAKALQTLGYGQS